MIAANNSSVLKAGTSKCGRSDGTRRRRRVGIEETSAAAATHKTPDDTTAADDGGEYRQVRGVMQDRRVGGGEAASVRAALIGVEWWW